MFDFDPWNRFIVYFIRYSLYWYISYINIDLSLFVLNNFSFIYLFNNLSLCVRINILFMWWTLLLQIGEDFYTNSHIYSYMLTDFSKSSAIEKSKDKKKIN